MLKCIQDALEQMLEGVALLHRSNEVLVRARQGVSHGGQSPLDTHAVALRAPQIVQLAS